ncbi:MAG: hypothetical protein JW892_07835 [Anaerolineae bacterium]|nr:hypothetical protein [Anaerolineae bacterium]
MKRNSPHWSVGALLVAAGLSGGIALARAIQSKYDPERAMLQRWINQALDRVLQHERQHDPRPLTSQDRFVIFSDHHKGARNDADDFTAAEATYLAALDHYLEQNFTLIIMGDAEDLWEERPQAVLSSYRHVFESEARFYPERYLRIHGNHDDLWQSPYQREKYLGEFFPGIEFHNGILFTVGISQQAADRNRATRLTQHLERKQGIRSGGDEAINPHSEPYKERRSPLNCYECPVSGEVLRSATAPQSRDLLPEAGAPGGELLLVHGHQGTLDSDAMASLSQFLVRNIYRLFQIVTGLGRSTPASDACLRALHDTMLYHWVAGKERLLLIAGHTHRPVWSSRTHLEKLMGELHSLLETPPAERPPDFGAKVQQLREDIKIRARKYPPCNDSVKTRPCYFNTGCCRYADGDITGIELADGEMRLIKWSFTQGKALRAVLESAPLSEIFYLL